MDSPADDSLWFLRLPPWKLPYTASLEALRLPALVGVLFLHIVALIPSFLQHFTVLKQDANVDIAYSISIWIGIGLCACFAVPGYWLMTAPLLAVHGVLSAIAGAAACVMQTLVYFAAQMKCTDLQTANLGCSTCPCAIANSCKAGEVGPGSRDSNCTACLAWGKDTCETILKTSGVSYWGAWMMAPLLTAAAATSIILSQRVSSERQAATGVVEESRKTLVEAQTALQQAGRLPTHEAEALRAALRDLWRSERDELRLEARQFVADAVAQGHVGLETALPDERAAPRKSGRSAGSKIAPEFPQPPAGAPEDPVDPDKERSLGLLVNEPPPRTAASSPDVVIDVGGGINADADQLSDHVRIHKAPSYTLSPTSPAPDSSPLVGSPDPMAQNTGDWTAANVLRPDIAGVATGTHMHAAPVAWGSLSSEEELPRSKKSGKKKSKDKDKDKEKKKGKGKGAESPELEESPDGKSKKDKDKKSKKSKHEEAFESPKKDKKSKSKKDKEPEKEASPKKEGKSKDSKEKKEKKEKKAKE